MLTNIALIDILNKGLELLKSINSLHELLHVIKPKLIGKNSALSNFMQQHKNCQNHNAIWSEINYVKSTLKQAILKKQQSIAEIDISQNLSDKIDITLPARGNRLGSMHPINIMTNKAINVLASMGFIIQTGPEGERVSYNFDQLNITPNHPARDMQDTFYIDGYDDYVLRTHTSPVQLRYATNRSPPIKLISTGRVYRVDMDATHSPMFHQLECLWVAKDITFANLKWLMQHFLQQIFDDSRLTIRMRASFFPFTTPSAEIDIKNDDGTYLEVAGCGMVHPNVLNNMSIDSCKFNGLAFGVGIDRLTMLYYGIPDLRTLFKNNINFLEQFRLYT
jgi:phenylalanyl-tRNA synthetase alpha chain